jgi:hypothetical protein
MRAMYLLLAGLNVPMMVTLMEAHALPPNVPG